MRSDRFGPNREIIYFPLTGLICVGPRQEW
jgi:hypothetical protein